MFRVGCVGLLLVTIGGCSRRPLSGQSDRSIDARIVGPDSAGGTDTATQPRDAVEAGAQEVGSNAADGLSPDTAVDAAGDSRDGRVDAVDAADANRADGGSTSGDASDGGRADGSGAAGDGGPTADGGCGAFGNGHTPQPGPLFAAPMTFPIPDGLAPGGSNGTAVGIGDVTGDGRPDVIVGSYLPAIVVYPQTADGLLAAPVTYPINPLRAFDPGPPQLDLGDMNGDGRLDVVFDREDGIGLMLGTASGELGPEQRLPRPPGAITGSFLAIADLDGDRRSDLVLAPYASNGVEVRLQNASGGLVSAGFFRCAHEPYQTVAIGDVDGDALPDIVLGGFGGYLCVVRQKPSGEFAQGVSVAMSGQISGVAVGRFGAGDCGPVIAFVVHGNKPNSQLGVVKWGPAGLIGTPAFHATYDIPMHMASVDVDDDGRKDLVVMHIVWLKVGVFRTLPTGGVAAEELYETEWINHGVDRIAVGDVDGDGRPDIVNVDLELSVLYHR